MRSSVAVRDPAFVVAVLFGAVATGAAVGTAPRTAALGVLAAAAAIAALGASIRIIAIPTLLPSVVAVLSLVLLRAPVLVDSSVVSAAAIVPFVAAGLLAAPGRTSLRQATVITLAAYVGLLAAELMQGALVGAYSAPVQAAGTAITLAAAGWFAFRFFAASTDALDLRRRMALTALAPGVYALTNALLHLAGITNNIEIFSAAAGAPASMLQTVGITTTRVSFPLAVSINNFGVLCAAGLVAAGTLALRSTVVPRRYAAVCAAACVYCMLRGDSRGPLIIGTLLLIVVLAFGRVRLPRAVAVAAPLSSLAVVAVLGAVATSPVGSELSAPGRDVATGSGRSEIWRTTWAYFEQGNPRDLIGYGAGGQISSGVSRAYAFVFPGQERGDTVHAHNAFIQQALDGGLIGVLILVTAFYLILSGLTRRRSADDVVESSALLGAGAALLLGGFTESVPSYLAPETLVLMLVLLSAAAVRPPEARVASAAPSPGDGPQGPPHRQAAHAS